MKNILSLILIFALSVQVSKGQTSITLSGEQPIKFTSIGTGIYDKTVIYHGDDEDQLLIDLAKTGNNINTDPIDFAINSRGGTHDFFKIKGATGNVGIGTQAPTAKLHIASDKAVIKLQNTTHEDTDNGFYGWLGGYDKSGDEIWWLGEGSSDSKQLGLFTSRDGYDIKIFNKNNGITIKNSGNVGIGTTTPDNSQGWHRVLDVKGQAHSKIIATSTEEGVKVGIFSHGAPWNNVVVGRLGTESNHDLVLMAGYGRDQVTIKASGNVGIGTRTPGTYKLAVNGSIRSKEVVVEPSPWPDYVFKDSYDLPKLEEVEEYINKEGHLKNIPSAEEVKHGIKLGEINTKLLEKIEELTLYTIAQEKKLKAQEARLQKLENLLLKDKE